jgi:hypothetical protein
MWYRLLGSLIVPIAVAWIRKQERRILADGVSLDAEQQADARAVGVSHPERIRLLRVETIPSLRLRSLRWTAVKLGVLSPHTAGLTAGYGIFIREDFWRHRALLVHELVHTAQYERLGGIRPFLCEYLRECLVEGYPLGPLVQETASAARRICR